jgi:hypothetical protein
MPTHLHPFQGEAARREASGIGYLWRDEIAKMPSSWPVRQDMAR